MTVRSAIQHALIQFPSFGMLQEMTMSCICVEQVTMRRSASWEWTDIAPREPELTVYHPWPGWRLECEGARLPPPGAIRKRLPSMLIILSHIGSLDREVIVTC